MIETNPQSEHPSFKSEYAFWGAGSIGTITMINSVTTLYLFFLSYVIGLSPALAGTLILVSKIVDMVSDPLMGWISDRSDTRWGRRRPFMFIASFFCAGSMIALFAIPGFETQLHTSIYVLSALCFYALALTMFNVPYLAMPAEMTDDYHERNTIMSYRALFLLTGSFLGSAVAGKLLKVFGEGQSAYITVSFILAGAVLISMLIAVFGTSKSSFTTRSRTQLPSANQLGLFLANTPFLVLGGIKAVQFLQLSAGTAVSLFFFTGIMKKDVSLLLPFGIAISLSAIISLRVWLPIIKKFGKREAFMGGLVLQSLVYLSWLLAGPEETMFIFMLRAFCIGILSGGILICGQSMIVDTIDYDRRLSGINREGLYSSVFSFIEKSTYAIGPFIIGLMLSFYGYDASLPRGAPQPEATATAYYIGQAIIPAACSLLMFIGLFFYRLDEETLNAATVHELGLQNEPNETI